ncbi:MAG TPA: DNA polymerase III subunit gamma/tau [Desulfarculaceae bacterium]|nr:DNA polymerase III subunit gamma/tau [Desulfarculaceae bacterium]
MTEAYQVLARKWRPQLFSELKGLEHITRTLKNAIRLNRIGHAFLFTGSRGVGKTSAARIFAKALNCKSGSAEEPCNSCENCVAITAGNAADVIEIDGASNRGIDEIRLLRENVTYLPQNSPYKIYIIDEVHMLTTEAFNALLKTLEEPPAHVKFIMATTDVHKMPMTILSRCQRFDFGRLTEAVIAATLVEIGVREKFEFGSGATELLAREARGSMRDALSLLDQVRSYAGETISVADMRQALGLIESRHCFSLLENIVCGELGAAVSQINDLEQAGVDLKRFSEEFLFYLRDALFLKLSSKLKNILGISSDEIELLVPLVSDCNLPYWQQLFALWQQHHTQIKTSQTPRLALEMALIELGMARDLKPVDELMVRIDQYLTSGQSLDAGPESSLKTTERDKKKRADYYRFSGETRS